MDDETVERAERLVDEYEALSALVLGHAALTDEDLKRLGYVDEEVPRLLAAIAITSLGYD